LKTLLLPDFVGHPICYLPFVSQLATPVYQSAFEVIDYGDYPEAVSIEDLAVAISNRYEGTRLNAVVGYSFGGLVAFEISQITRSPVMMIDTHLWKGQQSADLEAWRKWITPEHKRQINTLISTGEVSEKLIKRNLKAFWSYAPSRKQDCAILLKAQDSEAGLSRTINDWPFWINQLEEIEVEANHSSILRHPTTIQHLNTFSGRK
jgi:thioesterase domain-containing protein